MKMMNTVENDFVSVKIEGKRVHKQKRLLLTNPEELYCQFKLKYPHIQVGLSKFCELRPAWCVTVDGKGMHSVCVCETHQNLKLLVSVIPCNIDYKDLIEEIVCDLGSRECMVCHCDNCKGPQNLKLFLEKVFEDANMDMEDTVNYKQWTHGGQSKLQSVSCTVSEFMDIVTRAVDEATVHHFIAKSQAGHLRKLKETLDVTSAIILLDFAENYSFVCQDAVQGFH